ncbi:MAG: response regulator transcription factor [Micrococcales bacterium]|nr:response regulator transcription factor [Micrococcales bacterium]
MADPIRVLLVDDDPLVRAGLTMILGGAADITVVGEASDGAEGVAAAASTTPDVVLMDVRMPRMDGLEATRRILAAHTSSGRLTPTRVVVLTTFDTDDLIVEALRVGAAGFLLKDTPPARLVESVRLAAAGEPILSPSVTVQLISRVARPSSDRASRARSQLAGLTPRELDVALAVGQGMSNADIADELDMGLPTVKTHVTRLLAKLHADNRVQIALLVHDATDGTGRLP